MPNCEYIVLPNCECTKEFSLRKYFEGEHVHRFVMGLDTDQFETVRLNSLAIEPLPSLNNVSVAVLREESQHTMAKGMESRHMLDTLASKVATMNKSTHQNRARCTHCENGDERSYCYELVGYP